ncbi:MAG: hypothetical protein GX071_12450 [Gammaproteobacteria bacterium]|nr:hypothetical protein [Gammaproteobacteria bacterium]
MTTVAGMDVGKTCHFVVLAKVGKYTHVVYTEKIENSRAQPATPKVLDRVTYFKVTRMCIDAGPDLTLVNQLVDARPFISAVVYVRSIKGIAIYEEKEEGRVINADRTKTLSELLGKHNSGEIRYPMNEDVKEEVFAHLATTKKIRERSADGSMIERFIKTKSEDHWVHALNYGNIAAMASDYCSGQLIPDTDLSFSSASTGAIPPLKVCGRSVL